MRLIPSMSSVRKFGVFLAVAGLFQATGSACQGADAYESVARPFLNKYCLECHGGEKTKGGVDFAKIHRELPGFAYEAAEGE